MAQSNSRALVILLLTSGFFMTGLFFDYLPTIVDMQIKTYVELATNQEILSFWSKPPLDFHSYYWLYDVMNVEGFMAGEKVQVRKVGPYHFTSRSERKVLELSENKYRLFFNSTRLYQSRDPQTEVALDEPLRLLNTIYGSMLEGTRQMAPSMDPSMRSQVYASSARVLERFNETLFMNITARAAILGRPIPFLKKVRKMIETFGIDIKLPNVIENDLFGYLAIQNNTWQGPYEMYTGYRASQASLGDLISYQGRKRQTEFQGRCNRMQTSLGELRPMPLVSGQVLEIYRPEFCRILRLKPNFEKKTREGIVIGYSMAREEFLSAAENPDNQCFCVPTNGTKDNYCSLSGVVELAPCSYYSPILVSLSNIELDPKITRTIGNWEPEMRDSALDPLAPPNQAAQFVILKRLGVPIAADFTITMFMKIVRDPAFKQTASVPEVSYVPVVMVRETITIPPKLAQMVVNVETILAASYHIKVVMYLSAIVLLCWLTSHYYGRSGGERVVPTSGSASGGGGAGGSVGPLANGTGGQPEAATANRQQPGREKEGDNQKEPTKEQSEEPAGGQPAGGSGSGSTAANFERERAESKDSIRSLPPSRVSRSSIDEELAGADNLPDKSDKAASGEERSWRGAGERQAAASGRSPLESAKFAVLIGARFFSKVDELKQGKPRNNRANATDPAAEQAANQSAQEEPAGAFPAAGPDPEALESAVGRSKFAQVESELQRAPEAEAQEEAAAAAAASGPGKSSKAWFMKVCSNFVRMLNELRSSISDASQLDISENNVQDKQLEMLAGKIDNWYGGMEAEAGAAGSGQLAAGAGPGGGPKLAAASTQTSGGREGARAQEGDSPDTSNDPAASGQPPARETEQPEQQQQQQQQQLIAPAKSQSQAENEKLPADGAHLGGSEAQEASPSQSIGTKPNSIGAIDGRNDDKRPNNGPGLGEGPAASAPLPAANNATEAAGGNKIGPIADIADIGADGGPQSSEPGQGASAIGQSAGFGVSAGGGGGSNELETIPAPDAGGQQTVGGEARVNSGTNKAEAIAIEAREQQTSPEEDAQEEVARGRGEGGAVGGTANNRNNNSSAQSNKTIITNNNNNKIDTSLDECETLAGADLGEIADDKRSALEQIEQALAKQQTDNNSNNTTTIADGRRRNNSGSKTNSNGLPDANGSAIDLARFKQDQITGEPSEDLIEGEPAKQAANKQSNGYTSISSMPIRSLATMNKKLLAL